MKRKRNALCADDTAPEPPDMWAAERIAWSEGYFAVCGIDEAGRGPLAGPVVAACVVLPHMVAPHGVADSKALSPAIREALFPKILQCARGVGVGIVDAGAIDEINILNATHKAMRLALGALPAGLQCDYALIDGLPVKTILLPNRAIVRGDALSISIAAASIIAKVTRDRMMVEMDRRYPGYGFARHKGYGTAAHLAALKRLGPCPIHRRSFRPVSDVQLPLGPASEGEDDDCMA